MHKMRWLIFSVGGFMTSFTTARQLYRSDALIESLWGCLGLAVAILGFITLIYSAITLQLAVWNHGKHVTRGPYGLVRNPAYLSGIVINVGLIIVAASVVVLDPEHPVNPHQVILVNAGGILSFWLASWMEERYNTAKFGEDYEQYVNEVPRLNPIEGWRRFNQRRAESEANELM
jgi:protein-S-isoprenylcysteine O-methyltransferase Ste14